VAMEAGMKLLERSQGQEKLAQSGLLVHSMQWLHPSAAGQIFSAKEMCRNAS